jgi:Rrf2 family protein
MKLTQASDYALHALMYMVRHISLLPIPNSIIAKSEGVSTAYLAKIFQQLRRAGIVKAGRGDKRGYVLSRPAEKINLLEVFEAVEGAPLLEECFLKYGSCSGTPERCKIYAGWHASVVKLREFLAEVSLADIAWSHTEFCSKSQRRRDGVRTAKKV